MGVISDNGENEGEGASGISLLLGEAKLQSALGAYSPRYAAGDTFSNTKLADNAIYLPTRVFQCRGMFVNIAIYFSLCTSSCVHFI